MQLGTTKVDVQKVLCPRVRFTPGALLQLKTMIENDFTLSGKYFRVLVSGKGCDGFTYSTGFTDLVDNDFMIKIENDSDNTQVLIDPFAAFYLQDITIDYVQDFENDREGFVVINHGHEEFTGKFWLKDSGKIPPTIEASLG